MALSSVLQTYFSLHPLWNLKVEFPFLCLAQRPSQSFGVAYLLCTLVYPDKSEDTHDPPEHIKACSVHLLLFGPQTVLKEGGREGGIKSTQICRYVYPLVIFILFPQRHH